MQIEIIVKEKYSSFREGRFLDHSLFLICQEGRFCAIAGEEAYELQPGEGLLIPPHAFSSLFQFEENGICLALQFNGKIGTTPYAAKIDPLLAMRFCEWFDEEECKPLAELVIMRMAKEAPLSPISNHRDLSLFFRAMGHLEKDIANGPTLEALADHLNISLSSLKRLFANLIGIGVHEYLIDRRIDLAKQFLRAGKSVTETAALCGFSNQAYFSAAFKKATGHSPKEHLEKKNLPQKTEKKASQSPKPREMPSYLL
ncbi:MAG: helix-turn-helix domain-containing protein [Clostridia bacterium]|nr:helix-turn-helix domain-containing protein [Clostridia bacterium]